MLPDVAEWMPAEETSVVSESGEGAHIVMAQAEVWSLRSELGATVQGQWVRGQQS